MFPRTGRTTRERTQVNSMPRRWLVPSLVALSLCLGNSAAPADEPFEVQKDVEYSNPDNQPLKLDLTTPKKIEGLAPAIIAIHGGGWSGGSKEFWDGICGFFARRGYVAISVNYRFAPKYTFPAEVDDVKTAVRWLRANAKRLKIDPERIGAVGDSAGGHLSMMLGTTGEQPEFGADHEHPGISSRVQCVVDFYGPTDFPNAYGMSPAVDKLFRQFVNEDIKQSRRRHVLASPMYWVTPDSAPMLLIHGTKDPVVSFHQAEEMRDRLKDAAVEVEFMPIEGGGHGFGGAPLEKAYGAMFAFFDKHLKNEKGTTGEKK
jgi:acetyl esterase/lipase